MQRLTNSCGEPKKLLDTSNLNVSFNGDKFEPAEFGQYFKLISAGRRDDSSRAIAEEKCRLDPRYPVPLMTQTLAKLSDVTRSDIELLDDQGQEALLADLEHLMLAGFPQTEIPPATRVSFAAGRIARIAAERLRPVSELATAEHRVFELKQEIEAKAGDREVARGLTVEMATAKREFCAALRRYQRTETRDCRRTFWLLMKALHDYPEKLRLWLHVLNYCRFSGHKELGPIFEELQEYSRRNPLAARFVRATVLSALARHIFGSARLAASADALPRRRRRALRYLVAVLRQVGLRETSGGSSFYERASEAAFRCAVGSVAVFVTERSVEAGIRPAVVRIIERLKKDLRAIDWTGSPEDWVAESEHSLSVWGWWAESKLQASDAVEPGIIWRLIADRLPVTAAESWEFWKLYPGDLPTVAQRALKEGTHRIRPEEHGWLFETPEAASLLGRAKPVKPKSALDLAEWATWVDRRSEIDEFDPRLGEWTCLEITRQLSDLTKRHHLRQKIHPRNFLIPAEWVEAPDRLTWEVWRNLVVKHRISVVRTGLVRDGRIVPEWAHLHFSWDADAIQGLALVLLGLLRRNFRWPAVWNPAGQQRAWAKLARGLIGSVPCSSWTCSILEACLMPRARENLLMSIFVVNQFGEVDTADEPPEIGTFKQLELALEHSQGVLRRYQLSMHNHEPRQLVPISLDQLSRSAWTAAVGEEL